LDYDDTIAGVHSCQAPMLTTWTPLACHEFEDNPPKEGDFPSLSNYRRIPVMSQRARRVSVFLFFQFPVSIRATPPVQAIPAETLGGPLCLAGANRLLVGPVAVLAENLVLPPNHLDEGAVQGGGGRYRAELPFDDRLNRDDRNSGGSRGRPRQQERLR